jgi:hypothetical protein
LLLSTKHVANIWSESNQRVRVVLNVYLRPMISVRWHRNNPTERVGLVQIGHHHSNTIQLNLFSQKKLLIWEISITYSILIFQMDARFRQFCRAQTGIMILTVLQRHCILLHLVWLVYNIRQEVKSWTHTIALRTHMTSTSLSKIKH